MLFDSKPLLGNDDTSQVLFRVAAVIFGIIIILAAPVALPAVMGGYVLYFLLKESEERRVLRSAVLLVGLDIATLIELNLVDSFIPKYITLLQDHVFRSRSIPRAEFRRSLYS